MRSGEGGGASRRRTFALYFEPLKVVVVGWEKAWGRWTGTVNAKKVYISSTIVARRVGQPVGGVETLSKLLARFDEC